MSNSNVIYLRKWFEKTPPLSEQRNCFASTRETLELLKAFSRIESAFLRGTIVRHGRPLLQGAQASRQRIRPNLPLFCAPAPLAPIFSFQPTHSRRIGILDLEPVRQAVPPIYDDNAGRGLPFTNALITRTGAPPHSPQSPPAAVPPDRDPCPAPLPTRPLLSDSPTSHTACSAALFIAPETFWPLVLFINVAPA